MTLETWRRDVAGFTLAGAAKAAGISQVLARSIEQRPDRAALGAVISYVRALGGDARLDMHLGGTWYGLDV